jgi:prepilin-type N-terminal cleavage/methylation domain-containing protein
MGEHMSRDSKRGFTIIEMVIVILLTAIMAAIAIPQFIDYRTEAKNAKAQQFLGVIRVGIANQYAQQILRCGAAAGQWPVAAAIQANDVTFGGGPCTTTGPGGQIFVLPEVKFVADHQFPENPWGTVPARTVIACNSGVAGACSRCNAVACNGSGTFSGGWCYNVLTGDFWADSANNRGTAGIDKECDF